MGRWKGVTFKEYIREELACYSAGMSSKMKQNFKFVNIPERPIMMLQAGAWKRTTT
jgi:hypothetical protein